jgi:hypothetical protein
LSGRRGKPSARSLPARRGGRPERGRRRLAGGSALALLALAAACAPSPNRGTWRGEFAGSLSGVVEFRIDARGTELTGAIEGQTADGAPFSATMEGQIRDEHFYATFEGAGRAQLYRLPFTGFMRGRLGAGAAEGDWEAELRGRGGKLAGTWTVEQVAVE